MLAFVTGASAGIGREIAVELSKQGYDLFVVARRAERLEELKRKLDTDVTVYVADLSNKDEVLSLCDALDAYSFDIAVNNAGFGLCGHFCETDVNRETEMISLNVTALHILTKYFVKKFVEANKGTILNVASIAGFLSGPYMATYYATKAYVLHLTRAIRIELKERKSRVRICALCPGPVKTEFDKVASIDFSLVGMDARKLSKYAVRKMQSGKGVIVPGGVIRLARILSKFAPSAISSRVVGYMQKKKMRK